MAKILVVDDSVSIRKMLTYVLEESGHDVVDSKSAEDALEKIGDTKFQLVLSDLNMPGMDGIDLTKELRTRPLFKSIPILILTTEKSQERKLAGKNAGVTGWINKPFNPEQLVAIVEQVVQ